MRSRSKPCAFGIASRAGAGASAAGLLLAASLAVNAAHAATAGSITLVDADASLGARPVTTLTRAMLERTGHAGLAAALEALVPALGLRHASAGNGDDHVRLSNLRGLAADQMLVLVNGKRRHAAAMLQTGAGPNRGSVGTDLDAIPLSAVSRVEVELDAATGRYGSGALAGVINVVLDDASSGGELTAQYGQRRTTASGVPRIKETVADDASGELLYVYSGDRAIDDGDGDLLNLSGSWGFDLTDSGFMRFAVGYSGEDATNRSGYDTRQQYPLQPNGDFDIREESVDRLNGRYGRPERDELNVLFNAALDVNDALTVYGFTALATRNSESAGDFYRPVDPETVTDLYPEGLLPLMESDIDDRTYTLGARGTAWSWDWDASYSVLNNEIDWKVKESLNPTFGALSPTSFATGNTESDLSLLTFDVGRGLTLFAQPAQLNLGVEIREDDYEIERGDPASRTDAGVSDPSRLPLAAASLGFPGFPLETDGSRSGTGLYADLEVGLGSRVTARGGVRYDEQDDVDSEVSAALSFDIRLTDALHARVSGGTGFRAPAVAQTTYLRTVDTVSALGTTESGIYPPGSAVALSAGGGELGNETAQHLSASLAYRVENGLSIELTAYQIDVDDRVVFSDVQSPGAGVDAAQFLFNGADVRHRGIDAAALWPLSGRFGELDLKLAFNLSDVDADPSNDGAAALIGEAGLRELEAGQPDSRWILGANWRRGRFDLDLRLNGYGEVEDAWAGGGAGQTLDAVWLVDLDLRYRASEVIELGVGVHNLFDEYPDVLDSSSGDIDAELKPFSAYSPFGFDGSFLYGRVTAKFR